MKAMLRRFPDDIYDDARVAEEDFERRVAEAKPKESGAAGKPQAGFAYDVKKDLGEFADCTPSRGRSSSWLGADGPSVVVRKDG